MKLPELHDRFFELLCIIDDICTKHHITYFLRGGTEIGAVREGDFIAWDDDVDIQVLREDYPRFIEAMINDLPEHLHIIGPEAFAPGFYDFVTRIYDDRYLLRKETEEELYYRNLKNYLFIDVFILDKAPKSALKRQLFALQAICIYGMAMGHRYKLDWTKYSLLQKAVIAVLSTVGKSIKTEKLCEMFSKTMRRWKDVEDCPYRVSGLETIISISRMCPFCPAEWYESVAYGCIRGRKFPVVGEYDKELTLYFGDYMKPPADRSVFIQHLDPEDRYTDE